MPFVGVGPAHPAPAEVAARPVSAAGLGAGEELLEGHRLPRRLGPLEQRVDLALDPIHDAKRRALDRQELRDRVRHGVEDAAPVLAVGRAEHLHLPLELAGELSREQITQRVAELLARVGLSEHANKYPAQLSGGQKQRVGIARALSTNPKILLCDEATSALDPQTTAQVLQLLAEINRELGLTIVLITHEMDVIRRVCDQVAVMDGGSIVEQGPVAQVFLHPQHPTTRRFVQEDEQVDENEQRDDFAHVSGKILRLTFQGEATYAPLLGTVARETGVDYSILAGRIDRIKDTPYGQLTLALTGGDIDAALARFQAADVHLEVLR